MRDRPVVLLTDRAWPDDLVEREILDAAGADLVAGPGGVPTAQVVQDLVEKYRPDAIMTCWAPVTAAAIQASPGLKVVARMGVGLDNIDVEAATQRQVLVTNVPDYCIEEVSDHAVGMVLNWTRGLHEADRDVRSGIWNPAGAKLRRLSSLTCGIVGYGRIGRASARKLAGFGCRVLASSPHRPVDAGPAEHMKLDEMLSLSDVIILNAPLTPQTVHLIGAAQLARMRPGSLLVNVSRGGLVDISALAAALANGHLGGAALDVWESEPAFPEALRSFPGVLLTPHLAFSSDVSLVELRVGAAEDVARALSGETPHNVCNPIAAENHGR